MCWGPGWVYFECVIQCWFVDLLRVLGCVIYLSECGTYGKRKSEMSSGLVLTILCMYSGAKVPVRT